MFHFENTAIWTSEFLQCVTPKQKCCLIEKKSPLLIFSGIIISSIRRYVYAHVCYNVVLEWFPVAILVHQNGTPIWHLHTKLYKGAWNVSANNSETVGHKDQRLKQTVYIIVFHNISFSWLLSLDSFQFFFVAWQWKWSVHVLFIYHAAWIKSLRLVFPSDRVEVVSRVARVLMT